MQFEGGLCIAVQVPHCLPAAASATHPCWQMAMQLLVSRAAYTPTCPEPSSLHQMWQTSRLLPFVPHVTAHKMHLLQGGDYGKAFGTGGGSSSAPSDEPSQAAPSKRRRI